MHMIFHVHVHDEYSYMYMSCALNYMYMQCTCMSVLSLCVCECDSDLNPNHASVWTVSLRLTENASCILGERFLIYKNTPVRIHTCTCTMYM